MNSTSCLPTGCTRTELIGGRRGRWLCKVAGWLSVTIREASFFQSSQVSNIQSSFTSLVSIPSPPPCKEGLSASHLPYLSPLAHASCLASHFVLSPMCPGPVHHKYILIYSLHPGPMRWVALREGFFSLPISLFPAAP